MLVDRVLRRRGQRFRDGVRYDAFLSYSHAMDGQLAPVLQTDLERFNSAWHQPRIRRVFRDDASLTAHPDLWSAVEMGLASSRWFVLLASPAAAASDWVDREVAWWLDNRSPHQLLLVVTEGELAFDRSGRVDAARTTSLPPSFVARNRTEPRWVDLRWVRTDMHLNRRNPAWQDHIADIAAAVSEAPKDDLVGEHVRRARQTTRLVRGVVGGLTMLLIAALLAGIVAVVQRNDAQRQARIATARQLAATAVSTMTTNLQLAQLLAAAAFQLDPNNQTRATLFQAATSSPHLAGFLHAGADVTQLAGSADGHVILAGLSDGRVLRWEGHRDGPRTVARLPKPVKSLSISGDGRVTVATDGVEALLLRQGRSETELSPPVGNAPASVAVSPSGRTVVMDSTTPYGSDPHATLVLDLSGSAARTYSHSVKATSVVVPSDDAVLLYDEGYGGWERRRTKDWRRLAGSLLGFGTYNYGSATSGNGRYFSYTNGASEIPVWESTGTPDIDRPALTAEVPIDSAQGLALSPDGRTLAVSDSGTIHVAPVARRGQRREAALRLTGQANVSGGLQFYGDSKHLLSASGDSVAVWNLEQADRLSRTSRVPMATACNACSAPQVSISPHGERIAVVAGDGGSLSVLERFDGRAPPKAVRFNDGPFASPVWIGDQRLVAPQWRGSGAAKSWPFAAGEGHVVAWPAGPTVASRVAVEGRELVTIDRNARLRWHDLTTGAINSSVDGLPITEFDAPMVNSDSATISPDGALAAVANASEVLVWDLIGRSSVGKFPSSDTSSIVLAGSKLFIQHRTGVLEIRDARDSTAPARLLPGDPGFVWPPVPNLRASKVARHRSDGSVVVVDVGTGDELAKLAVERSTAFQKTGLAFTADGERLISVTEGGGHPPLATVLDRELSDAALVRAACEAAGRSMTQAEWQAVLGDDQPAVSACA